MGDSIVGPCSRESPRHWEAENLGRTWRNAAWIQYADASGVHFQQTMIRVTTRAKIQKEPAMRFLLEGRAKNQSRSAIPRAKRDTASGNWVSVAAGSPYLGGNLADASKSTLRAYALTCWSAFTKHWQFCCRAVSEKSTTIGAIAAASSTVCEQCVECGTDETSPCVARRHKPHNRWTPHRTMPLVLNIRATLQKTFKQEKALQELLLLLETALLARVHGSGLGLCSLFYSALPNLLMNIPDDSGKVKLANWPDIPPSASAMMRRSSQPTSEN